VRANVSGAETLALFHGEGDGIFAPAKPATLDQAAVVDNPDLVAAGSLMVDDDALHLAGTPQDDGFGNHLIRENYRAFRLSTPYDFGRTAMTSAWRIDSIRPTQLSRYEQRHAPVGRS